MPNTREFRTDLEALINRYSMARGSDTPDWILADYLYTYLRNYDTAITAREHWHGRAIGTGLGEQMAREEQADGEGEDG